MEDKRKLTAAIMGAITAYIHTERKLSSAVPEPKPQPEANQQQPKPAISDTKLIN